jgi:8-oxo-dGTP pyrophosphatase MutT (NUDIX family)
VLRVLSTHVEVYLFRRRARRVEFLALRRAKGRRVLPGVWQPVTGKRLARETARACAAREVFEETGLRPRRWWGLETATLYFDAVADALCVLPLFAAEVGAGDRVRLSDEHDAHRFVSSREAARRFLWESQRRGLDAVRREVLRGGALARALALQPMTFRPVKRRPGRARGTAHH